MSALLTYLDMRLGEARQMRLAMDQWELRRALFATYRKGLTPVIEDFRRTLSDRSCCG